jgi:hypothetical protein
LKENYDNVKLGGAILGGILVIIGLLLMLQGFSLFGPGDTEMGEEGWFEEESSRAQASFGYMAGGMLLLFVGSSILYYTQIRRISKYVAHETSPAIETVGGAMGKGITSGIKESGGIKISVDSENQQPKEIIKIRCRNCGYLETEDAEFCSKCGQRM